MEADNTNRVPIAAFMASLGFEGHDEGDARVYEHEHRDLVVVVRSENLDAAEQPVQVRLMGVGREGKPWCLYKGRRIPLTGTLQDVLDRIKDRVDEAVKVSKDFGVPCKRCGATTYTDTGRCVVKSCRVESAAEAWKDVP